LGYTNIYGIDISPQQVEVCKQFVSENVECINALEFLKDKNNEYDLIFCNDIIEHLPKNDSLEFCKLINSALSRNGCVVIKTVNMSNPVSPRSRYMDITHETGFTEESISQLLRVAGFKNVSVHPCISAKHQLDGSKRFKSFIINRLSSFITLSLKILYMTQGITKPKVLTLNLICTGYKNNR